MCVGALALSLLVSLAPLPTAAESLDGMRAQVTRELRDAPGGIAAEMEVVTIDAR